MKGEQESKVTVDGTVYLADGRKQQADMGVTAWAGLRFLGLPRDESAPRMLLLISSMEILLHSNVCMPMK